MTPNLPSNPLPLQLPTLPVFGWNVFKGRKDSSLPCVLGHPNRLYTGSGRAAIALALATLGVGRGDSVLVPTYHCPTMVSPIVAMGAQPLFFPIDNQGMPRLDFIAGLELGNVRAMLAAHYFGVPQPMSRVRQFCDGVGIALIEDCAHAMFGAVEGRAVGAWGQFAIASLTKFFPVTDGGCLVTNVPATRPRRPERRSVSNELRSAANAIELGAQRQMLPGANTLIKGLFVLANRLRHWKNPRGPWSSEDVQGPSSLINPIKDPAPTRIDSSDASMWAKWIARTAHRDRIVSLRRRNYQHLASELGTTPGVRALMPQLPDASAPYVFPLWAEQPEASYMAIRAAGVPIFRWDQVWPGTPIIEGDYGIEWATHVFQIGCHQDLGIADLSRMANRLRQIITGNDSSGHGGGATGKEEVR